MNTPPVSGSVEQSGWKYYSLDVSSTITELDIILNITNEIIWDHDCDVYVKFNSTPSWLNWDYQDPYIQSSVFIAIPSPHIGTWYI
jgi:hypothetical protein